MEARRQIGLSRILQRFEHATAEINTAIREGFYVFLMPPNISYEPVYECDEEGNLVGVEMLINDMIPQYKISKMDPKRAKFVDHRDELSKRRSPDYAPHDETT